MNEETMTKEEMIQNSIKTYCNLQRIKKANGDQENPVLDFQMKEEKVILATFGVNVEDLDY